MPRKIEPQVEWRGGTCRVKWPNGERYPGGRRKFDSKGGFTDEDEAYNHGLDRMHELRHGKLITNKDSSTLMGEWCDAWVETLDHAPKTERTYRSAVKNHIRPYFADRTVGELDVLDYRAFKKHLSQVLARDSAKNVLALFGMMMDDAVDAGLRHDSPVERNRRRGRYRKQVRPRKQHMDVAAVYQLALNAKVFWGFPGYVFFLTMAFTGMRTGELYGLRREYCPPNWPASDPDPDGEHAEQQPERYKGDGGLPAIRVQQQHQYGNNGLELCPPKYDSYRTLVIPPFLATLLRVLLDSHDSEWVFPSLHGGPLASTNFDVAYWKPISCGQPERKGNRRARYRMPEIPKVAEFAGKRKYRLRHGQKEWLDDSGRISRIAVEGRMGHELQGVEATYSNVTPAMEREIIAVLQERWVGLVGPLRLKKV